MLKNRMRSLGASTGTAMLAVLVVGVVAFGAGTIRPLMAERDAAAGVGGDALVQSARRRGGRISAWGNQRRPAPRFLVRICRCR